MASGGADETESPFDKLRERQREILRLVPWHANSAAIAREVGSTPTAVDKQIKLAMQTLGVQSRQDAARLLIAHEQGVQRSDPPTQDLRNTQIFPLPLPVPTEARPANDLNRKQILLLGFAVAIAVPILIVVAALILSEGGRIIGRTFDPHPTGAAGAAT